MKKYKEQKELYINYKQFSHHSALFVLTSNINKAAIAPEGITEIESWVLST